MSNTRYEETMLEPVIPTELESVFSRHALDEHSLTQDPWLKLMSKNCWKLVVHYLAENATLEDYAALTMLSYPLVYSILDNDKALADLFFYSFEASRKEKEIESTIDLLDQVTKDTLDAIKKTRKEGPWYKNPWNLLKPLTLFPGILFVSFDKFVKDKLPTIRKEHADLINSISASICGLISCGSGNYISVCTPPNYTMCTYYFDERFGWTYGYKTLPVVNETNCNSLCETLCDQASDIMSKQTASQLLLPFGLFAFGFGALTWILRCTCVLTDVDLLQKKSLKTFLPTESKNEFKGEVKEVSVHIAENSYAGLEQSMIKLTGKPREELMQTSTADVLKTLRSKLVALKEWIAQQENPAVLQSKHKEKLLFKLFQPLKMVETNDAQDARNEDNQTQAPSVTFHLSE